MITEVIHRLVEWQNAKANRSWHVYSHAERDIPVVAIQLTEGAYNVRAAITHNQFQSSIQDELAQAFVRLAAQMENRPR